MTANLKILVLEDDATSLMMLEELVRVVGGLIALTATSVGGARQLIIGESPHIAILDLELPDGNGTELLAEIRARKQPISVAMLTASRDQSKIYKCGAWKPDAMFVKPLDPYEVGGWIGQQIAHIRIRDQG